MLLIFVVQEEVDRVDVEIYDSMILKMSCDLLS